MSVTRKLAKKYRVKGNSLSEKDLKVSSSADSCSHRLRTSFGIRNGRFGKFEAVKVETPTTTFYVQTVDGEYRSSLGCWITTDTEHDDIDHDDYPEIDIVIKAAEKFAESLLDVDNKIENPNYHNKDASPYQRRFNEEE